MIPFDIEYLQPSTLDEAVAAFTEARSAGKSVRYLGGGTELVTSARDGKVKYEVLVDLKRIPDTTVFDSKELRYGTSLRLSDLVADRVHPLLAACARGIADHTVRNSITLGGNICGMLPYRETVLALLVLDAELDLATPGGRRAAPVRDLFDRRLRLAEGEIVVSVGLPESARRQHWFYRRRTRGPSVDYPLATVAMVRDETGYRVAVSGAFGFPVRDAEVERLISAHLAGAVVSVAAAREAASEASRAFAPSFRTDQRGSGDYRRGLVELALAAGLVALGGKS